jgi:anti-anti-sigma factor
MGASWSLDGSPLDGSSHDGASYEGRRLVVHGELDLAVEQAFVDDVGALVDEQPDEDLWVNLAGVEFIDSSGVRALVRLRRAHGARVRFEHLSSPVRKVLEIAGLLDHLGIVDGLDGLAGIEPGERL